MEFLFTNQIASIEALIIFACILLLFGIFGYDTYLYLRQVFAVMMPKRPPISDDAKIMPITLPDENSPLDTTLTMEAPIITLPSQQVADDVVLDNPILYDENGVEIPLESPALEHEAQPDTGISSLEPIALTPEIPENLATPEIMETPITLEEVPMTPITVEDVTPSLTPTETPLPITESAPIIETDTITETLIPIEIVTETPSLDRIQETPQKEVKTEKKHRHHKTEHTDKESHPKPEKKPHALKPEKREKLTEIINTVKTLIARGQIDEARTTIVSGLALEKNNRELNIIIATLYEREHAYEKAELVLKDIALEYPDDTEILTHLATDLAMQHKYEVSYDLYKSVLSLGGEKEDILYTLTHLASEMGITEDILSYARSYLKQYPHNPEILWLYSSALISTNQRKEAIEVLIKLKNLTPYNQEIAELIQKLVTEEELALNFVGEKNTP